MVERNRNATSVVGTANVLAAEALFGDTQRNVIVITNTSTAGQIVTVSIGDEATAGEGIILYPTGAWAESMDSAFRPTNDRVFIIASAAAGTVSIYERTITNELFWQRG